MFEQATWIHAQEPNELVAVKIVPFLPDNNEELEAELSIMNKVKNGNVENLVHIKALYFTEDHNYIDSILVLYKLHPLPSKQASPLKQSRMGIVMNWYEEGSLRMLLHRTQHHKRPSMCLNWTDKLQLALDVCNGLGKLHEMALLHRDVKADNVLLRKVDGCYRGKRCFCSKHVAIFHA